MKLYLAVAVLMLAFVAYTEAQEETIEQKFARFSEQMTDMSRTLAEKVKTKFDEMHNSDFATTSRTWIQEQLDKMRNKLGQITQ